jgi:hypothetical protein
MDAADTDAGADVDGEADGAPLPAGTHAERSRAEQAIRREDICGIIRETLRVVRWT